MSKSSETISVEHAFNPELRQAQADWDAYQYTRPYEDEKGNLHDPSSGAFISRENAGLLYSNPEKQEEIESFNDYYASLEELSLSELATLSALHKDSDETYSKDIEYIIRNKIENMGLKTDKVDRDWTTRDKSEVDMMFDRVMKLRDAKLQKIREQNEAHSTKAPLPSFETTQKEDSKVPAPDQDIDSWKSRITLEQAIGLDQSWLEQTGEWDKDPGKPPKVSLTREYVKFNQDKLESELTEDLPSPEKDDRTDNFNSTDVNRSALDELLDEEEAIVDDNTAIPLLVWDDRDTDTDEPIASVQSESLVDAEQEKNEGIGKRVIGALAVLGLLGLGVWGAKNFLDSDEKAPVSTVDSEQTSDVSETETTSPVVLADPEDIFGEDAEQTTEDDSSDDESTADTTDATEDTSEQLAEDETAAGNDNASESSNDVDSDTTEEQTAESNLRLEDIVINENAAPMEATEGNTAWDRAEAQGLDMDNFNDVTRKSIAIYNEYATSHDLAQLEHRDGNIWMIGTNNMITPKQYAIYAQIMQDVIANMTGANPNTPVATLPETD